MPLRGARGQRRRKLVEVGGGARQTRQADHGYSLRGAAAIFAHVEPQPILRGNEKALALIVSAVSQVRHQMRGGLVHRLSLSLSTHSRGEVTKETLTVGQAQEQRRNAHRRRKIVG